MKLDYPLSGLIKDCEKICEAECCGSAAFDFSPFHIASHLMKVDGRVRPEDIANIRGQLAALEADFGRNGNVSSGVTLEDMNWILSGEQVTGLVEAILKGIVRADELYRCEANAEIERFDAYLALTRRRE